MCWHQYPTILPIHLPSESHAGEEDDCWEDFESVNDPDSGKKLPSEVHATHDLPA